MTTRQLGVQRSFSLPQSFNCRATRSIKSLNDTECDNPAAFSPPHQAIVHFIPRPAPLGCSGSHDRMKLFDLHVPTLLSGPPRRFGIRTEQIAQVRCTPIGASQEHPYQHRSPSQLFLRLGLTAYGTVCTSLPQRNPERYTQTKMQTEQSSSLHSRCVVLYVHAPFAPPRPAGVTRRVLFRLDPFSRRCGSCLACRPRLSPAAFPISAALCPPWHRTRSRSPSGPACCNRTPLAPQSQLPGHCIPQAGPRPPSLPRHTRPAIRSGAPIALIPQSIPNSGIPLYPIPDITTFAYRRPSSACEAPL